MHEPIGLQRQSDFQALPSGWLQRAPGTANPGAGHRLLFGEPGYPHNDYNFTQQSEVTNACRMVGVDSRFLELE
jgi:hypothetical protein